MRNRYYLLIFILTTLSATTFSQEIVDGFYITNACDTVISKIEIGDLFQLHNELTIIDSSGKRIVYKPSEIKGFSFYSNRELDYSKPFEDFDHDNDQLLLEKGYHYKKKTFSLASEINAANYYKADSLHTYESCRIDSNLDLFLFVRYGNGGRLHANELYSKVDINKPFYSTIWFLIKDNKVIDYNNKDLKDWIISGIEDYPALTSLVQEKKITSFPFDFNIVIEDYNNWSTLSEYSRPDTSMTIKGILDANQYYKTRKYFAIPCVIGTAFFLPGMISAVVISHNPKEENIKIPESLVYRDNSDYSKAYKHKAFEKKYKSAGHGAITGGILSIGLIILLASL